MSARGGRGSDRGGGVGWVARAGRDTASGSPARLAVDPVLLEVLRNALGSIVDEMALVVARTARSATVRDALDYSTALCAAGGEMVAQGLGIALHLGSFPGAVSAIRSGFRGRIFPGDVFVLNDPYGWGGIHLPDIYVIKPIFAGRSMAGFCCVVAHHVDVGGIVAGSNSTTATEIYQEGLRIPAVKLYERGVRNDAVADILAANVRVPVEVLGDLGAQLSAVTVGERGYVRLMQRHGRRTLDRYTRALLDLSEQRAREEIAAIPDGTYRFSTHIDHDSVDPDPVIIRVTLTVAGDELTVDFEGSSPQVRGGINSPLPFSSSGVYAAVRLVLDRDIPHSAGYFRPIHVRAPVASVVNPVLPAACGARGITGFRVMEAVLGALAQAVPDRVPADGEGGNSLITIGGRHPGGRPFVYTELFAGARGGSSRGDGPEGVPHPGSNNANMPVEVAETGYPLLFEQYALVEDSGGPGRHRGALAQVREFRYLGERSVVQLRSDKRRFLPYGLAGGSPGTPSSTVVNPGRPDERVLPTIGPAELGHGDVLRHQLAGGGGWGDPLERDPALVLADVVDGRIGDGLARDAYGVVIARPGPFIDRVATERERTSRTQAQPAAD